ncbi:BZ3500_MvSof-1268-A1-R1_Chr4-2g07127 [Microbotryum saponariae]|uniref:BZ3500_MvSof-1268-A1-R1_Chr4-2g07127 protein n=1 Tax=Microbotryum saponariae TaxID=289078 RepID=A0A2X0KW25_9BASI|nr:BZ3500_MvSof-1268-A1-R1_Chr4-2g07127 [Microbotryum saponariae]SDA06792.1 BZ3501_MvSof-1269-A2-R1_Chr4-2g06838 [Microbotryum saponariae]
MSYERAPIRAGVTGTLRPVRLEATIMSSPTSTTSDENFLLSYERSRIVRVVDPTFKLDHDRRSLRSLPQRPLNPTSPTRKQQLTLQLLFHCSTIAGKKILNEYIALGVFGMTGFGAWAATRGGDAKATKIAESTSAKLNSSSEEEAAFIQNFINDLEHQDKAQNKH